VRLSETLTHLEWGLNKVQDLNIEWLMGSFDMIWTCLICFARLIDQLLHLMQSAALLDSNSLRMGFELGTGSEHALITFVVLLITTKPFRQ
jgi:hypothetical protein